MKFNRPASRISTLIVVSLLIAAPLSGCSNDYVSLQDIPQPALSAMAALPIALIPVPDPAPAAGVPSELVTPIQNPVVVEDAMPDPVLSTPVELGVGNPDADSNSTDGSQNMAAVSLQPTPIAEPEMTTYQDELINVVNPASSNPVPSSAVPPVMYYSQAGDTLPAIASRFNVEVSTIVSATPLNNAGFINPNTLLMIPPPTMQTTPAQKFLPDSEVVYSPSALDFDINAFVVNGGGYLATYREYLNSSGWTSGAGVIRKIAIENSINPRLLLSLLQYRSNWVYGQPADQHGIDYPMGNIDELRKGLYNQLIWAVNQISYSYYGWRDGSLNSIPYSDGTSLRAAPESNAGTFAMEYLFAQMLDKNAVNDALYSSNSLASLHTSMFGDPWTRAVAFEPLFPSEMAQPKLILPIEPKVEWALTGGPHSAWGKQGARAALDFAPSGAGGCSKSDEWVLAAASGLVVRSGGGVVVLDLDGDGNEQTGWDLFYMHIATEGRPVVGQWLDQGDQLGHPSCEGGVSTGTHFHFARKYNGEWILAGGPLPFDMDGWIAHSAAKDYKGTLTRGEKIVTACTCATADTYIFRDDTQQSN